MKISKLFHYLYAAIMFLPLVVIPVFMIYSHRHVLTERTEVDIQYKYQSNEVNSTADIVSEHIYFMPTFEICALDDGYYFEVHILNYSQFIENNTNFENDGLMISNNYDSSNFNYIQIVVDSDTLYFNVTNEYAMSLNYDNSASCDIVFTNCVFMPLGDLEQGFFDNLNDYNSGILPQYTDYNVIESVDVQDTNSDIMSVTIESFNNTIDSYFNMKRVFNLNDLYNWFNVNFFNSASPISFNILFNLFTYWLFVSLLWLLFDAFMYIPLIMHNAIDKARIE